MADGWNTHHSRFGRLCQIGKCVLFYIANKFRDRYFSLGREISYYLHQAVLKVSVAGVVAERATSGEFALTKFLCQLHTFQGTSKHPIAIHRNP